jgi:hypothetical protein
MWYEIERDNLGEGAGPHDSKVQVPLCFSETTALESLVLFRLEAKLLFPRRHGVAIISDP